MAPLDGREQRGRRERLRRMLRPESAVFIGGQTLEPAIAYCRARGYKGRLYAVNPTRERLADLPCLPRVGALPEAPDLAFVAVPKEAVAEVLPALSALGAGAAVCNSAGFSEMAGQGQARQAGLIAAAGQMPVLGPNCPGFANFADGAVFMMDHFGDHHGGGKVAVLSNGGAYLSDLGCADRGLALAYLIGLGNQAMVPLAEMLSLVLEDARVRAVNLYFESIQDAPLLSQAALLAARREVPVVALKGGRSRAGERATRSHTASLAGEAAIASALFERLGFIEVGSQTEAIETLKMLVSTRRPKGRRTALATSSGSYAVLGADHAERAGLQLPPPGARAAARLSGVLPPFVGPANPLDIATAHDAPEAAQRKIYDAFLSDEVHIALQVMCFPPPGGWDAHGWTRSTRAFAAAAAVRGLPCAFVNTLPEALPKVARADMLADGMAPLQGLEDGLRAVGHAARYAEMAARLAASPEDAVLLPPARTPKAVPFLDEARAKGQLALAGITVPRSVVWRDEQRESLDALRFPLVAKALAPALVHKSESGGVRLNLPDAAAVARAVAEMRQDLAERHPKLQIDGFLIEEMVTDGLGELLVGLRRVDGIGVTLTLGSGGIAAELLKDRVTLLLPAARPTIETALRSLKLFPLLDGWRGRDKADVSAALDAIESLANWMTARAEVMEIEVNPLILRPSGKGAVAVDALLADADLAESEEGKAA